MLLKAVKDLKDIPLRDLEEFLKEYGLDMTYSGISRILNKDQVKRGEVWEE